MFLCLYGFFVKILAETFIPRREHGDDYVVYVRAWYKDLSYFIFSCIFCYQWYSEVVGVVS